jgi:hypothetical protein
MNPFQPKRFVLYRVINHLNPGTPDKFVLGEDHDYESRGSASTTLEGLAEECVGQIRNMDTIITLPAPCLRLAGSYCQAPVTAEEIIAFQRAYDRAKAHDHCVVAVNDYSKNPLRNSPKVK